MKKYIFLVTLFITHMLLGNAWAVDIMPPSALASFPNPPADHIIYYGEEKLQFGELRLPSGKAPHPVIILVHGGYWLAKYDFAYIRKTAAALADAGIATWAIR